MAEAGLIKPGKSKSSGKSKKSRQHKKNLHSQIMGQMEFYFSDANLQKDRFLKHQVQSSSDGLIDLNVFLKFNKIKALTSNIETIIEAVKKSELLKVDEEQIKVGRKNEFIEPKDVDERTVYVECLPQKATIEWVQKVFSSCGKVVYVSLPKFKSTKDIKGFAFVEFLTKQQALTACELMNNPPISALNERPGIFPRASKLEKHLEKQVNNKSTSKLLARKRKLSDRDITTTTNNNKNVENNNAVNSSSNTNDNKANSKDNNSNLIPTKKLKVDEQLPKKAQQQQQQQQQKSSNENKSSKKRRNKSTSDSEDANMAAGAAKNMKYEEKIDDDSAVNVVSSSCNINNNTNNNNNNNGTSTNKKKSKQKRRRDSENEGSHQTVKKENNVNNNVDNNNNNNSSNNNNNNNKARSSTTKTDKGKKQEAVTGMKSNKKDLKVNFTNQEIKSGDVIKSEMEVGSSGDGAPCLADDGRGREGKVCKTIPELRVIPKSEWLMLRQEYLDTQKSNMSKLKKQLRLINERLAKENQSSMDTQESTNLDQSAIQSTIQSTNSTNHIQSTSQSTNSNNQSIDKTWKVSNKGGLSFVPNVIVKIVLPEIVSKKFLKEKLSMMGKIEFIEMKNDDDDVAHVRCADEETSRDVITQTSLSPLNWQAHLLQDKPTNIQVMMKKPTGQKHSKIERTDWPQRQRKQNLGVKISCKGELTSAWK